MIDYFTFKSQRLDKIEYWRLSNDCYEDEPYLWRKIKDKKYGLNFVAFNTKRNKELVKSIFLNIKLSSIEQTYTQKTFIDKNKKEFERSIWFKSVEDFKNAVNFLERFELNE